MASERDGDGGSEREIRSAGSGSTSSYGQVLTQRFLQSQNNEPFTASPEAIASNLAWEIVASDDQRSSSEMSDSGQIRTMDDVRNQVADNIAVRAITRAETVDGTRVGVITTLANPSDPMSVRRVADKLKARLTIREHLFAVATSCPPGAPVPLLLVSSSHEFLQRAALLVTSKFARRTLAGARASSDGRRWFTQVRDLGASPFDEDALWDVVRKAARTPMEPLVPPPGSLGIEARLARERARIERIAPRAAYDELREPASPWPVVLVDIRPEAQRREEGGIAGALVVERNVLEWRFDPRCPYRLPVADRYDLRVIVFCSEGYTSSLAAASLRDLGLLNATDIIGGYHAWRAAGLPAEVEILATGMQIEDYSFA